MSDVLTAERQLAAASATYLEQQEQNGAVLSALEVMRWMNFTLFAEGGSRNYYTDATYLPLTERAARPLSADVAAHACAAADVGVV